MSNGTPTEPNQCIIPNGPRAGQAVNEGDGACFIGEGNEDPTWHLCIGSNSWKDEGTPCNPDDG